MYHHPAATENRELSLNPGTIQKAADTLVAGDMVKILPGIYYEKFTPKNSGSSAAYITYTADPGTVVLDRYGSPIIV